MSTTPANAILYKYSKRNSQDVEFNNLSIVGISKKALKSFPFSTLKIICSDMSLASWTTGGITTIGNILHEGKLRPFQQLHEDYNIPNKDFFKYLRVRHA